jgi:hypothetical protein
VFFLSAASFGRGEKKPALLRIVSGKQFVQDALSECMRSEKKPQILKAMTM